MGDIRVGSRSYNLDKAELLCETPQGTLYKKKGSGFFLYNPEGKVNREKFTDVSWADANNLVKTYGSTEVHLKYFSTFEKSTNQNKGRYTSINLDEYSSVRAFRNAQLHNMTMTAYIKYLIDKDDQQNNYCK